VQLLNAFSHICRNVNNAPEHDFLIGIAYLNGVDVEVNRRRGIELITSAAESGYLEAMETLAEAHKAAGNYQVALEITERIGSVRSELSGEDHPEVLKNLAQCHMSLAYYTRALSLFEEILNKSLATGYGDEKTMNLVKKNIEILKHKVP